MFKIIRKMQGLWIWTLFSCLTNLNWVKRDKCAYVILLNSNLEWFCKWLCNALLLNGIVHTMQLWTPHCNIDHVYVHCTLCWSLVCHVCRIEVEPEPEATPSLKTLLPNLVSKASKPPFDHVDKYPFPSQSRLCMNRMITLLSILPHSWTHILCMTYHLVTVVSKPQS